MSIQLRYPSITGRTTEERQQQMEQAMRSMVDQLNMMLKNTESSYPVGAIYISTSSTNPGTLFGGTWEPIKDRFLLAAGSSYTAGTTGGEATHTLTVDEMPQHKHNVYTGCGSPADAGGIVLRGWSGDAYKSIDGNIQGKDKPHNNMPPYLAVYVWKRTK